MSQSGGSRSSSMQRIVGPERKTYFSLFLLSEQNIVRRICRIICESKPFEYFILTTIMVNCILLALNTPLPSSDKSELNMKLESAEIYLLGIFCVEALLKVISLGFILHPGSYLRNGWNILDFVVVVTGILSIKEVKVDLNASALKALRAMRVLRPLKLVSGIPSLQVVMKSIARAMAPLLQICLLVGFVIVIYAIIGLEFLPGLFHYACFNSTTKALIEDGRLCGVKNGRPCPTGTVCQRYWGGPNEGITSFDNMLLGMLTVFTCITCEGWTDTMYWTFDVMDKNGTYFWIYYYTLHIIGAQFMLNLVLGVLSGEFAKERERVENRREFLKVRQGQQIDRAFNDYMNWLTKAEEVIIEEEEREAQELKKREKEKGIEGNFGMTNILAKGMNTKKSFRLNLKNNESLSLRFQRKNKLIRLRVRRIVKHPAFYWSVIICVFLNTVSVAVQHYNQPQWLTQLQNIAEVVFISFFFSEMCLKLYGIGPRMYFKSQFNTFDCVVVCGGVIEIIVSSAYNIQMGISVLRALRLLRLFRFTRYWNSLKNLVASLLSSIKSILSLLFLLFLFILIFALLGMQLFGGTFADQIPLPRTNFDDFWNAMLAVFQILTGEDWNTVMYNGIMSGGGPKSAKGLGVSLYFVLLVVLGNYTLLNVFLAIAVDNLTNAQLLGKDEKKEQEEREKHQKEIKEKYAPKISNDDRQQREKNSTLLKLKKPASCDDEFDSEPEEGGHAQPGENFLKNLKNPGRMTGNISSGSQTMLQLNTFFIFTPGNPLRKFTHWLVNMKHFDNFILGCILISSALLAVEDTINEDSKTNQVLLYLDCIFTSIFALEVLIKLINYGAILHKGAYFRDEWNFIDALVVSCAIASLVLSHDKSPSADSEKIVGVLRVLRVLRPLKAINKAKKLKAVFQCMMFSLKNVLNILVITFLFLVIFSVMGVQLFQGKSFFCTDTSKTTKDTCKGAFLEYPATNPQEPVEKPREWKVHDFNFDNIFKAMLTLFTSSTGEGWPNVMFNAIDATGIDKGPLLNNQIQVALFFIFFVIIFTFFFLNIFVALIILTFQEQGEAEEGECELERNQRDCLQFAMIAKPAERFMPENPNTLQYKVWRMVDSIPFEYLIMLLIAGNTMILMLKFDDQPAAYEKFLNLLNDIFTFMFTGECMLKLFAFRKNYFRDGWNVFDFIIVLGSLLDFTFTKSMKRNTIPFDPSLFRLFRAARLIKLLRRGYTIRVLLWTFLQSFKALPYVGMLIFLLFFIYAIIGMQMFSTITLDSEDEPYSNINRQNNFRSFFQAIQVLFRSATGENWHNIMLACAATAKCDPTIKGKTADMICGSDVAYPYFLSFIFFCSFLMLNLFVAVIMDNFGYLTQDESILGPHHLDEFVRVWAEYDPRATGRIKHTEVCQLLRQMSPPIGLGTKCPKVVAYKRLIRMNMTLHPDNTVDFTATLFALVRTALDIMTEKNNLQSNDMEMRDMLKRVWPKITKKTLDRVVPKRPKGSNQMTVGKIYCAKLIYENYKHLKKQGKDSFKNDKKKDSMAISGMDKLQDMVGNLTDHKKPLSRSHVLLDEITDGPDTVRHRQVNAHLNAAVPNGNLRLSTPNLAPNPMQGVQPLSVSIRSLNLAADHRRNTFAENGYQPSNVKQQIAMAIRSGHSPYAIYGIQDNEEDDWC
eukprot:gene16249-17890_t